MSENVKKAYIHAYGYRKEFQVACRRIICHNAVPGFVDKD